MKKPTFPIAIIIFLVILSLVFIVIIGGIVYLARNPNKIYSAAHNIYLKTIQDPDADKDGLTDIAEIQIYKTDPSEFSSRGDGISDGEYIYGIYKKAFEEDDESLLSEFRDNLNKYKASYSVSTSSLSNRQFLGEFSLDEAFTQRSLEMYNPYVGESEAVVEIIREATDLSIRETDHKKSIKLLQDALSKDPDSAFLKYHIGLIYQYAKQYDQALSVFKEIMNDPTAKSPLFYNAIAYVNLDLGNDTEFIRYMELSIKEFPDYIPQYITLATYYHDKNQLDKSEEVLNRGLKVEPRYAGYYNALAIIAVLRNDTKTELDLYKKALSYDFLYAPSHLNLSIIYDQKHFDTKIALVEAQIAMEIDPNARKISRVISIYNKLGRYAESEILEAELLKMPDIDAKSYTDLGLAYMDKEDYKQAEVYFRKAIFLEPRLSNAYNNLGIVLISTNRSDEAANNFKKAIEINPNYANAHNNLGIYYTNTGQYKEAQAILEKAVQLDPYTYRQYQNLGVLYERLNNKEKAIFYYKKAVELGSKDQYVLDYLKSQSLQ